MVALTNLNLPPEAWLSVEETGLMTYLQAPPDVGPSVVQVTTGLQNWKCAGRRLVEIGGRLPTATQLHQSFIKILTKHLATNKKVSFVFQQKSSTIPMMNPSPTEIVELFSFVEVTLIQYAEVAGHFPGVTALSVKPKPKKVNKAEVAPEEPSKEETQVNATTLTTPKPKAKGQARGASQTSPAKVEGKRVSVASLNLDRRRGNSNAFLSLEEHVREETNAATNMRWERKKTDSCRSRNSPEV